VLRREDLSRREHALSEIVRASSSIDENERRAIAQAASHVLTPDEFYNATLVVSLFQFYNSFVDLNGVAELSAEGYKATGVRLSTQGYAPVAPTKG